MPITVHAELRKISQDDFGHVAFEVMRHAFGIHRDLGRFFDEGIYQAELANRCSGARIEVPIEVSFEGFQKVYFVDLLVEGGAVFEIKTAEGLHDRHRVIVAGRQVGHQETVGTGSGVAVKLTAVKQDRLRAYEDHYQRFLNHANIEALHWVNLTRSLVSFRTLRRAGSSNDRKIT
ncbi:MAG: GxxExxY protein [Candidatus Saccharimonadales bacterium]